MEIISFTFNPFQENTYLLASNGKAILVDPGMSNAAEQSYLTQALESRGLTLDAIWLTHAHIDHVMGVQWAKDTYGVEVWLYEKDLPTLALAERSASMYGIPFDGCPEPDHFIALGDWNWNDEVFEVRWVPGHAPGHVVFIHHGIKEVVGGDVLFRESIGRTDLPGGDHDTLLQAIKEELYTLPDDYKVYSGHGPSTTIGHEKANNPFVRA